jgi:hypothetical protein
MTTGECGTAHIYLFDDPGSVYHFVTGFDAAKPVVGFHWAVEVDGSWDGGTDHAEWDFNDTIDSHPSWSSGPVVGHQDSPSGTLYTATVTAGVALTSDMSICFPYGPTDVRVLNG